MALYREVILDLFPPVITASTTNVSISSAPGTIGGVSMANGDRVLLAGQSTESQNGIYVFNGTGSALTRARDADSATNLGRGRAVKVIAGTHAKKWFTHLTAGEITLGSTSLVFEPDPVESSGGGGGSVNYSPFIAPASPSSDDDEFIDSYTWTDFQNTSGFSATVGNFGLKITAPNASANNRIRGAIKPLTLADGDKIYCHLACQHFETVGTAYLVGGMALVEDKDSPNTTDLSAIEIIVGDSGVLARQSQCSDWQNVTPGTPSTLDTNARSAFLMISRSGSTYSYWVSTDGLAWTRLGTQTSVTHNGVLLFNHNFSSGASADVYFRFFRRGTGGPTPIARRA